MEDELEQLEIAARDLLRTIAVIRALKPIQRQVPECREILRESVEQLRDITEPVKTPADEAPPAPGNGIDPTGSSNIGAAAGRNSAAE